MAKKPTWAVEKERARRSGEGAGDTVWLFGIHAVRDALRGNRLELEVGNAVVGDGVAHGWGVEGEGARR